MRTRSDPTDVEFGRGTVSGAAADLLNGDHQGSQRVISRFVLRPREDGTRLATVAQHWNVDRPDPR